MKKILFAFLILIICVSCASAERKINKQPSNKDIIHLSDDLKIERIKKSVYMITHKYPWPANSLLLVEKNGNGVMVDTPWTPKATEDILKWAKENAGLKTIRVVNSHFHLDNMGGNEAIVKIKADIYSTQQTLELVKELGIKSQMQIVGWLASKTEYNEYANGLKNIKLIPANKIIERLETGEKATLLISAIKTEIFYPGPAHTHDNVSIYFPEYNILFGGCAVKGTNAKNLGNLRDGSKKDYKSSIENLLLQYGNISDIIIVPGHGKYGGQELLEHTLNLASKLLEE